MWYTIGHMFDGEKLRTLRTEAGMTQVQLAYRADVQPQTINRLETGKQTDPRITTVQAIASSLGCSVEALLAW